MITIRHLGDITKINGAEIEPVDCITFGAPCQDLSVAGLRKGMKSEAMGDDETTRSGLFHEAVRITKEMRNADKERGRTDDMARPRYAVYENVGGAFSSNKGADFQAVLTELIKIAEPDAPNVPMPDKGKWSKQGWLYDEMGRWSVAWKLHDAQHYGVPQRRKRICVLADFCGLTAPEILLEPKLERTSERGEPISLVGSPGRECESEVQPISESVSGHTEQSIKEG